MSSNERQSRPNITDPTHPADDPAQMARWLAARGRPQADAILDAIVERRLAWAKANPPAAHPPGRGACAEDEPCEECARAYSEPDARDIEEDETA